MQNRHRLPALFLVAAALLLQACATTREPPLVSPRPAQATPSDDGSAMLDPAIADAARGYTQVKRDGALLFCKRERQTGSNMSTMNCITEAQLRQRAEDAKKFGDDMKQQGRRCTAQGSSCQGG